MKTTLIVVAIITAIALACAMLDWADGWQFH